MKDTLRRLPKLLADNRLMCISENHLLFRRNEDSLGTVFRCGCFEVHSLSEVLAPLDDLADHPGCPLTGLLICKPLAKAVWVMLRMIIARRDALLPRQRPTNLNLRQPGSSQLKDAPDDLRGFRIDEPMVLVCRIFHIALPTAFPTFP